MLNPAKTLFALVRETFSEWNADQAPRLAAAIAYYTALSIAPLLVLIILLVGLIFNQQDIQDQIVQQVAHAVGPTAAELVGSLIDSASNLGSGLFSTLVGFITLIFGATNVFTQLRSSLNTIWEVDEKVERSGIAAFVTDKLLSLGMVLAVIFLLLVSLVVSTVLSVLDGYLRSLLPGADILMAIVSFALSFGLLTLLFALIFKFLPDAYVTWKDVGIGAAVTAFLFSVGEFGLGLYLANSGSASVYGAAGSLVLILLWIYYSAQIVLFGAEFTQVYARQYGSRIRADALFGTIREQDSQTFQPANRQSQQTEPQKT